MTSRVLVIGASGFIGQALLNAVSGVGSTLSRLLNWKVAAVDEVPPEAQVVEYDVIINCSVGAPEVVYRNGCGLYAALARAASQPRVVHISSMTVYGGARGRLDELAPLTSALGPYAAAQVAAEAAARGYGNAVILRPGVEYGPGCPAWSGRIARLLQAGRLGDLGAAGSGVCNLLYIDDLLHAIGEAAVRRELGGAVFNLASAPATSWNEYFIQFGRALGLQQPATISAWRLWCERRLYAVPLKVLEVLATKLGIDATHLPPAITPSLLQSCMLELELDVRAAEQGLGVRWTPLAEGLRAAATHYRRR